MSEEMAEAKRRLRALRPSTNVSDTSPEMLSRLVLRRGINDVLELMTMAENRLAEVEAKYAAAQNALAAVREVAQKRAGR